MPTHNIHSPGFPPRVQFIDEDDAGGLARGLAEKIANARCSHADEHLHKLRPADAEERDFCLPGHSPGQKGFARPRRADQKDPFGNPSPQFLEFPRIAQKFHYFLELFFGFIDSSYIRESDLRLTLSEYLGFA